MRARTVWNKLKWLPCIKWPSSDEVDFGAFRVAFSLQAGVAECVYPDGQRRQLASFAPAKYSLLDIDGEVRTEGFTIERMPAEQAPSAADWVIIDHATGERSHLTQYEEAGKRRFSWNEKILIESVVESGATVLEIQCTDDCAALAKLFACFLVFERHIDDSPPAGGESD